MKRRLLSLLLVLSIIFTLLPAQAFAVDTATPFRDVTESDWFYDAVQYVRVNGFFNGTTRTTFSPNDPVTRGMFVTVLGRMAGVNPDNYVGPSAFTDVLENAYFAPYVAWASKYGIAFGTGDGKFSPYAYIDRQQMATFFVRYFEAFGVDYGAGTSITTAPADIDSVSNYARDAVLKLWRTGLLNGDGVNFNPAENTTRAQAAAICCRADQAVNTWYTEPGVPSDRIKIDPDTGLPYSEGAESGKPEDSEPSNGEDAENGKPENSRPSNGGNFGEGSSGDNSGGGGFDGTAATTYYEVTFALGEGQASIDLPVTKIYAAGTRIDALPTPAQQNVMFLGWYYDAALTQPAGASDTVDRNMTLYAKTGSLDGLSVLETPSYITVADVEPTFQLKLYGTNINAADLTITQVSANNAKVNFTVDADGNVQLVSVEGEDGIPTAVSEWEPGHTYMAVLRDESPTVFVHEGEPQPATIRIFNIIVTKQETLNLSLNNEVKFISKTDAVGISDFEGLFTASLTTDSSGETKIETVDQTGTFIYSGIETLDVGDVVAIYEGKHPQQRESPEDEKAAISYVEITGTAGNEYTYKTAEAENVLFIPDVLPVSAAMDLDPNDGNVLTVNVSDFDFSGEDSAEMGLGANTTVDVGDFIALFYGGEMETETVGDFAYKKITSVSEDGGVYTIRYTDVTEDEVLSAMDIYSKENKEIELTDGQIEEIEEAIEQQAMDSGFVDEAAEYLTALALETDGFQELAGDFDLQSYAITSNSGARVGTNDLSPLAGGRAQITKKEIKANIYTGKLKHFTSGVGVRAELTMNLVISVDLGGGRTIEITLQAVFEQEVMITVNASGGAIWDWAKKKVLFITYYVPYISDYRFNTNVDVGTYTGIGITATARTKGNSGGGFNWGAATGNSAGDKIVDIGKQIKALMDQKDKFLDNDLANGGGASAADDLAEKYAAMIKGADESWIEIFQKQIFSLEGSVDPFHILCYGVTADFVVEANLYATMGMTFEYSAAKRYNFSFLLFAKKCSNNIIDLETPHYEFSFYVMGTLGIRAGIELELGVGLISLKLDSIGITTEAGIYAQLWGYFYYNLQSNKNPSTGKYSTTSRYSGAMLIKIGTYLKIAFKAQLFSSSKLTYQPTLYEHQWPLITVGGQENVLGFVEKNNDGSDIQTEYNLASVKTLTLPSSLFSMKYLDIMTGEISGAGTKPGRNYDDATESRFTILMSDSHYKYNPKTNTVTINPNGLSILPDCTMTIRWKNGTLAFSSQPIERKVTIRWSDPANMRYISFDSQGGSPVDQISSYPGMTVTMPANPSLDGYDFGGWYTDDACTTAFSFPAEMPKDFNGEAGITVYAKWIPRNDTTYTVQHYRKEVDGTYTLISGDTEILKGTTGSSAAVTPRTDGEYAHFTAQVIPTAQIAGDGTTVVCVYYDRNTYEIQFTYGAQSSDANKPIICTAQFGELVHAPLLALTGYKLTGFSGGVTPGEVVVAPGEAVVVMGPAAYSALWTTESASYRVEHYLQNTDGSTYELDRAETKTGLSGCEADAGQIEVEGFTYSRSEPASATINGDGSTIVRLYYDRNPHTLTWETGEYPVTGGTPGGTVLFGSTITLPVSERTGFRIEDWYETQDCTGTPVAISTMPDRDLTLYAKWVDERVDIVIYINRDGQETQESPVDYPADRKLIDPDPITGYVFVGWTGTGIGDTPQKEYTIPEDTTGTLTFTAHWEPTYTVTFDYSVDYSGISNGSVSAETDAEGKAELPVPSYNYCTGTLTFVGWYTQPNGGIQVTNDTVFTEDQTLYAHWGGWCLTADGMLIVGDDAAMTAQLWTTADIRSVLILPGVTEISSSAFDSCTGLTEVIIPDSVTIISNHAFYGCTGLTEVIIPDSVTAVGDYAFYGCTGLTKVVIPDSVTSIGDYAFRNCTGLTEVIIPDSVTVIGIYAFRSCTGLTKVIIPDSVTVIGSYAFYDCTGLTDVYYSGTTDNWNNIQIGSGNTELTNAAIHCADGDITP